MSNGLCSGVCSLLSLIYRQCKYIFSTSTQVTITHTQKTLLQDLVEQESNWNAVWITNYINKNAGKWLTMNFRVNGETVRSKYFLILDMLGLNKWW